jgi:hypothetical protein
MNSLGVKIVVIRSFLIRHESHENKDVEEDATKFSVVHSDKIFR